VFWEDHLGRWTLATFGGYWESVWNDYLGELLESFSSCRVEKVPDEVGTEFEVGGQILDHGLLSQRHRTRKL
jgi:hypothetical protein